MVDFVSAIGMWHAKHGFPAPIYEFQRRAEVREGWVTCPFDSSHVVPQNRLDAHVRKCRLTHDPERKLQVCPFDPLHLIPRDEYEKHLVVCPKKPNTAVLRTVDYGFGPVLQVVHEGSTATAAAAASKAQQPQPRAPRPPRPRRPRSPPIKPRLLQRFQRCMVRCDDDGQYEAIVQAVSPAGDLVVVRWQDLDEVTTVRVEAVEPRHDPYWRQDMACLVSLEPNGLWHSATVVNVVDSETIVVRINDQATVFEVPWHAVRLHVQPTSAPLSRVSLGEDVLVRQPVPAVFAHGTVVQHNPANGMIYVASHAMSHMPVCVSLAQVVRLPPVPPPPTVDEGIWEDDHANAINPTTSDLSDDELEGEDKEEESGIGNNDRVSAGSALLSNTPSYDALRMRTAEEMAWECRLTICSGTTFFAAHVAKKIAKAEVAKQAWSSVFKNGTATPEDLGIASDMGLLPPLEISTWKIVSTDAVNECNTWIDQNVFGLRCNLVGFDTEWGPTRNEDVRTAFVALIQVATDRAVLLFSTRLVKQYLPERLAALLQDTSITKAGVDLDQDVRNVGLQFRMHIQGVFDAADEAVPLGFSRGAGTRRLCGSLLGKQLTLKDKAIATSSWQTWPLTPSQTSYAAADAIVSRLLALEITKRRRELLG